MHPEHAGEYEICRPELERMLNINGNITVKYIQSKLRLYGQPVSGRNNQVARRLLNFLKQHATNDILPATELGAASLVLASDHIRDEDDIAVLEVMESDDKDDEEEEVMELVF
jgi:hypothetical protein